MGSTVDLSTDGDEFWLFGYGFVHATILKIPTTALCGSASWNIYLTFTHFLPSHRSLIWKPPPHFGICCFAVLPGLP